MAAESNKHRRVEQWRYMMESEDQRIDRMSNPYVLDERVSVLEQKEKSLDDLLAKCQEQDKAIAALQSQVKALLKGGRSCE